MDRVEIRLHYYRNFKEDCERCDEIKKYEAHIKEEISFRGQLSQEQIEKLFEISYQCLTHKMYEDGIVIQAKIREEIQNRFLV